MTKPTIHELEKLLDDEGAKNVRIEPNGCVIEQRIVIRYQHDPVFHALVDSMTAAALANDLSPQDFADAMQLVSVEVRNAQIAASREKGSE